MKRRRLLIGGLLALGAMIGLGEIALRYTQFPAGLLTEPPVSAEFLDREGRSLRTILAEERRFSRRCELSEISPHLIAATLSAEDQRFHDHSGVDFLAGARAVFNAIRGGPKSGASTITQQLIKLAEPGPRTVGRKLAEAWQALRLERDWSKDRILAEYLNRLEYGNLQTGIAAASRFYFGKPPADLSIAEAALLAGLPKAPGRLDPHSNLGSALARQRWILRRMHADGKLTSEALAQASEEPLRLSPRRQEFAAPHFVDLLLHRRGLAAAGGAIRTTLDLPLTTRIERSLAEQLARIADKHATSGAAVVIDNRTGDVLALAGSGDYFSAGSGQVNGAWITRSPGSAVKPFTYLLAMQNGANPGTVVADVPTDFPTSTGLYRPNNYNHRYHGPVSLRFALGNSLNVGAIHALGLAGGPARLHRALRDTGITTLGHPADYYGPGLTLGNGEVRLLELASAYSTLARLGIYRPYRLLLREPPAPGTEPRVFDSRATYFLADMLADNTARAAAFGLNSYLAFDFPVACKTGTSSDYRDNWAVGYTPEFTVAVWVGNPDGSSMRAITGVTGAAPVLHDIFCDLRKQRGVSWFTAPSGIEYHRIHPLTGRGIAAERPGAITEKCLWKPEPERAQDFDTQGRVILPQEYAQWLDSRQNSLGNLAIATESAADLRIVNPTPGSIYFLDPDLPLSSQNIRLTAHGSALARWSSPSLECTARGSETRVQLREGNHAITVEDPATGRRASTSIEVRAL